MNTQNALPAGGTLSLPRPAASVAGSCKGTRPPPSAADIAILEQIGVNHDQIAALHTENVRLLHENRGLFPHEILTRDERMTHSGDFDLRADRMPIDVLSPMLNRMIPGVETTLACLTLEEAQAVFGFRYIRHGGHGELTVRVSEKKRVQMNISLHGR